MDDLQDSGKSSFQGRTQNKAKQRNGDPRKKRLRFIAARGTDVIREATRRWIGRMSRENPLAAQPEKQTAGRFGARAQAYSQAERIGKCQASMQQEAQGKAVRESVVGKRSGRRERARISKTRQMTLTVRTGNQERYAGRCREKCPGEGAPYKPKWNRWRGIPGKRSLHRLMPEGRWRIPLVDDSR